MQQITFQQATRSEAKARVGIAGPAGSGKTKTALICAKTLLGPNGQIFVIDTENNSASLYSDEFKFATFNMTPEFGYAPKNFISAIEAAEHAAPEGSVIILDSASHEWMGEGGALDMVDTIAAASKSKNTYNAWRPVTPEHRKFMEKIIRCKHHVIATYRTKVEFEKNDKGGYDKIGLGAITRDGADYEFTVWFEMDVNHKLVVAKTRCDPLTDKSILKPDEKFFSILRDWLAGATQEEAAVIYQEAVKELKKETKAEKAPVATKTAVMLVEEAKQYGFKDQSEVFGVLKTKGFTQFNSAEYDTYMAVIRANGFISTLVEFPASETGGLNVNSATQM
jgi:hypothetical protein